MLLFTITFVYFLSSCFATQEYAFFAQLNFCSFPKNI